MSALKTLGKMLGLVGEPDSDILTNERAAHAVLSRRNLFAGAAALAGSKVFAGEVFAPPWEPKCIIWPSGIRWGGSDPGILIGWSPMEIISIYRAGLNANHVASKF